MVDGNKIGNLYQDKVRESFQALGLIVRDLDKRGKNHNRCIDFYVYKDNLYQQGFLCEVKSVNVAGFDDEILAQISSREEKFLEAITAGSILPKHIYDYDHNGLVDEIEKKLIDALDQYNKSLLDEFLMDKESCPFVVALCFDFVFFPDQVNFDELLEKLPAISAILEPQRNEGWVGFKIHKNKGAKISFDQSIFGSMQSVTTR